MRGWLNGVPAAVICRRCSDALKLLSCGHGWLLDTMRPMCAVSGVPWGTRIRIYTCSFEQWSSHLADA